MPDSPDSNRPLLEVRKVSWSFGGVVANRGISLMVEHGTIVGLIGPNGSGKTTLLDCITGHHPIDTGHIWFNGQEISRLSVGRIARLGLLRTFRQARIFREMTCLENMLVALPTARRGLLQLFGHGTRAERTRATDLLHFVGLHPQRHQRAGSLSCDQQKLLEFAMALMSEPRLLLLDEPTAGINPAMINGLVERLRRANAELGITLLIAEHNMRVIMNMAEYIYCLAHGELLADGTPEEIRNDQRVIDTWGISWNSRQQSAHATP